MLNIYNRIMILFRKTTLIFFSMKSIEYLYVYRIRYSVRSPMADMNFSVPHFLKAVLHNFRIQCLLWWSEKVKSAMGDPVIESQ